MAEKISEPTAGGAPLEVAASNEDHNDQKRTNSIVIRDAKAATVKEQNMTLLQGIKTYPKAIAWSMLISMCIVMEGFDLVLLNTFCKLCSATNTVERTPSTQC
jgi:hypothetical protein